MFVSKGNVAMDDVADRLDARAPRWRLFEVVPGYFGQAVGLTVPTTEEKDERLCRQIVHRVLGSRRGYHVGRPVSRTTPSPRNSRPDSTPQRPRGGVPPVPSNTFFAPPARISRSSASHRSRPRRRPKNAHRHAEIGMSITGLLFAHGIRRDHYQY
jgi:hypothetical protein